MSTIKNVKVKLSDGSWTKSMNESEYVRWLNSGGWQKAADPANLPQVNGLLRDRLTDAGRAPFTEAGRQAYGNIGVRQDFSDLNLPGLNERKPGDYTQAEVDFWAKHGKTIPGRATTDQLNDPLWQLLNGGSNGSGGSGGSSGGSGNSGYLSLDAAKENALRTARAETQTLDLQAQQRMEQGRQNAINLSRSSRELNANILSTAAGSGILRSSLATNARMSIRSQVLGQEQLLQNSESRSRQMDNLQKESIYSKYIENVRSQVAPGTDVSNERLPGGFFPSLPQSGNINLTQPVGQTPGAANPIGLGGGFNPSMGSPNLGNPSLGNTNSGSAPLRFGVEAPGAQPGTKKIGMF